MWLLKSDGAFEAADTYLPEVQIEADAPPEWVPNAHSALVVFGAQADGRGFSVARQLRARGFRGTLTAGGPLIPDQARHAFQSGFDAVLITEDRLTRHGESAWQNAIAHSVGELYVADGTSRGAEQGIWALRHTS